MRLYKMELYKLLYRKIFRISMPAVLGILFAYFLLICVGEERSTINGSLYTGFEAIRRDREITEEFRGILTDEKAGRIIEEYGFPSQVIENYGGFRDENYLYGFVTEYLGNGYLKSWDDYRISTGLRPLRESELGKAAEASGRAVILDYAKGWPAFLELLQLGMILGSALVVAAASPVFSEEQQSRMAALLFTSREGREKDAFAKTAAAFTAAALIYIVITSFIFLLVGVVYGFDGGECMSGMTLMQYGFYPASPVSLKSTAFITFLMLSLDLLALFTLCAITLCVSAHQKTAFHTVVLTFAVWTAPLLLRLLFNGAGYLLASGTPLFLVMTGILADWYDMLFIPVSIAACILVCTAFSGWNAWRRAEANV